MSGGLVNLFCLVLMLIAAAWLLSVLLVPPMIHGLVTGVGDPATRGRRVVLTASIPWLVALSVGAAALATAAAKALGWIADHCPDHGLGHPHLCFSHLPAVDLSWMHGAVLGAVAVPVAVCLARLIRAEYRATRSLNQLKVLAASRGRLRILSAAAPFALAGGILQPVVLLSSGLLKQLSSLERRVVLAHEAAHLRHGDARRNLFFELLLMLHLPTVRRKLRMQWQRTLEERADDAAAQRFGSERVVETLLHVARLKLHQPRPGFSVAGTNLAHRAQRLLDGAGASGRRAQVSFEMVYATLLGTVFTAVILGHHALETLLGLIAGH